MPDVLQAYARGTSRDLNLSELQGLLGMDRHGALRAVRYLAEVFNLRHIHQHDLRNLQGLAIIQGDIEHAIAVTHMLSGWVQSELEPHSPTRRSIESSLQSAQQCIDEAPNVLLSNRAFRTVSSRTR